VGGIDGIIGAMWIVLLLALATPSPAPTKTETLAWLDGVLDQGVVYRVNDGGVIRDLSATLEGCTLTYKDTIKGRSTVVNTYRVRLGDLDPQHHAIYPIGEKNAAWWLVVPTRMGKPAVKARLDRPDDTFDELDVTELGFVLPSTQLVERVAKGLVHAITLCGGKPDPF
jgi:hypothetical protein